MLDLMFVAPSSKKIQKILITKECIQKESIPNLLSTKGEVVKRQKNFIASKTE